MNKEYYKLLFQDYILEEKEYSNNTLLKCKGWKVTDNKPSFKCMGLTSSFKKHLKKYLEDEKFRKQKNFPHGLYLLNKSIAAEYNSNLPTLFTETEKDYVMYDVESCYPNLFVQMFDLPKELKDKLLSLPKAERLRAIGSLASAPRIKKYENGIIKEIIEREDNENKFGFGFFNLCKVLSEFNFALCRRFECIVFFYADAFLIEKEFAEKYNLNENFEIELKSKFWNKIFSLNYKNKGTYKILKFKKNNISNLNVFGKSYVFVLKDEQGEIHPYAFNSLSSDFF